jgi:hypothetical protein
MNALLQLPLLYLTAFKTQRRLLALGAAALATGLVVRPLSTSAASIAALLGLALILLPVATSAGALCRALSAPRTHRFLPYFRFKMLNALWVLTSACTLACFGVVWLLGEGAIGNVSVSHLGPALLVASLSIVLMFIASGSPANLLWAVPLSYLGTAWISENGRTLLAAAGISVGAAAWMGLALLWALFGLGYLQARRISPVGWSRSLGTPSALGITPGDSITRAAAARLHLSNQPRLSAGRGLLAAIVGAVAIAGLFRILEAAGTEAPTSGLLTAAFVLSAFCAAPAHQVAKRSRLLWLKTSDRANVFAACESTALATALGTSILAALLVVDFAALVPATPWTVVLGTISVCLVTALGATYAGLLYLSGPALALGGGFLLCIMGLGASGAVRMAPTLPIAAIVLIGAQGGVALAIRSLAKAKWLQMDWSRSRAPRIASQSLRSG